ncbi:putative sigma factor [Halobacteriovorax marinus SJ]|uniref:Sigma factor n=1 Tax=Halobacteriovorax marinus (strain ATCC BAA-682 / DSM 15412 / SJ) TaxID=862908 RepID=E1X305_HALMS|nr:sigma-70 family RNA polymerase sigma factor [Halobacteriovorax marinus]CBW26835.1 putative sigma factor [Halobacteriovorax marinus SJ]
MQNFSDPNFINSLKRGDQSAMEILISAYSGHLLNAALGMGFGREKSQDIAHSTWLTFFEVVHKFEGRSHIRTFLFGIFYNKVSEYKRQILKYEKYDPIEEVMEARFVDNGHWQSEWPSDPHEALVNTQGLSIIEECMDKLPLIQKSVFYLKVVKELSSEEICHTLEISSTNLRQLLYRSKTRLKECIERKGAK